MRTPRSIVVRLRALAATCFRDRAGASAVEFALILPILLVIYTGAVELLDDIAVNRKVGLIAATVSNIVSQYSSISASSQLADVLNASSAVMLPYTGRPIITVSCISVGAQGTATVVWSRSLNGTARSAGSVVSIPAALSTPNTTLILGEASYTYMPILDFIHIGSLTLSATNYVAPRTTNTVNLAI